MKIDFWIPGQPKGAGSKHAFALKKNGQYTGRVIVTDTSGRAGRDWRQNIVSVAFEAMREQNVPMLSEPLVLRVDFIMPRPRSHFRSGKFASELREDAPAVHSSRPDATKLVRQLEDSLTNVLWSDDSLVVEQYVRKLYGAQPGARVTVTTYSDETVLRNDIRRFIKFNQEIHEEKALPAGL